MGMNQSGSGWACRLRLQRRALSALLAVGALASATRAYAADDGAAVSPSSVPDEKASAPQRPFEVYDKNRTARWALIATGTALLTLSYAAPCAGARGVWCLPFAGPIFKIKQLADEEARSNPDEDGIVPPVFVYTLLVEVAFVQVAAAGMITAGALLPRRPGRRFVGSLTFTPLVGPSIVGLAASGTL
jgi:hypothetical protein